MLIELPIAWIIVLNVAGWPVIQFGLAWAFTRMPATWFNPGKVSAWEQSRRFYERAFGIKRWKDWLPDAARWFGGGFAKGTLAGKHPDYLRRFIRETWRGELCHWAAIACAPVFFLWNPWWGDVIIVGYAVAANLPCIIAQRYNRARFQRLLARPAQPPAPVVAVKHDTGDDGNRGGESRQVFRRDSCQPFSEPERFRKRH